MIFRSHVHCCLSSPTLGPGTLGRLLCNTWHPNGPAFRAARASQASPRAPDPSRLRSPLHEAGAQEAFTSSRPPAETRLGGLLSGHTIPNPFALLFFQKDRI
eukprot:6482880-Amphidinium_carterae.1